MLHGIVTSVGASPRPPSTRVAPADDRHPTGRRSGHAAVERRAEALYGAARRRLLSIIVIATSAVSLGQPLKPLTAPREATVKVVWFKGKGENATSGTSAMKVRLAPNKSREASVGVMEEFAGGAGDQWRMTTWQAAIGASAFNRVPMTDYEFLVRVGGHIDGPSAGLLTTATFVALQRGKALKPATTMTGTINPDGSSGPVGGIVQKMKGAAADGITRFWCDAVQGRYR